MKSVVPIVLLAILFVIPSATVYAHPAILSNPTQAGNPITVWFDGDFQLTVAYPPAYEFNVAAKTAPGLWITSLHWDFGDGATLDVPFSGQSQVSDIRYHQYSGQGNFCVTVTAYDNAGNHASVSRPLTLSTDFTLTANPATQSVQPGGSTSYNVAVDPVPQACGGGVSVNLAITSTPPQGATWSLNPTAGSTPFTSTLQVQTSTSTPTGTYTITISGNSASSVHTTSVTLQVSSTPYFTLSAIPTSLLVPQVTEDQPARMNMTTVNVQSVNGFNSPVSLSVSGLPAGMTAAFSTPTVTPPPNGQASSVLTFTTPCSVNAGTYVVGVQGTGVGSTQTVNVNLSVSACTQGFPWWIFWWIILPSILGVVLFIPFLFIRRRPVVPVAPVPVVLPMAPPPPPPQPVLPCPVCGQPLRPVELKWYCDYCQRYVWIHPE
ncbi:MAG TPA: PKD domain-containing protein [Terriglobales bacterium]|nr:PKD domain-containing protein [Terriglobales bacterium]